MADTLGPPDVAGVYVGWRSWSLHTRISGEQDAPELYAPTGSEAWPAGSEMLARCRYHTHEAPHPHCACGLYAVTDHHRVLGGGVLGCVALWGTVIEATRGWRASHGYPLVLLCHKQSTRRLHQLATAYRVPVVDLDLVNQRTLEANLVRLGERLREWATDGGSAGDVAELVAAWRTVAELGAEPNRRAKAIRTERHRHSAARAAENRRAHRAYRAEKRRHSNAKLTEQDLLERADATDPAERGRHAMAKLAERRRHDDALRAEQRRHADAVRAERDRHAGALRDIRGESADEVELDRLALAGQATLDGQATDLEAELDLAFEAQLGVCAPSGDIEDTYATRQRSPGAFAWFSAVLRTLVGAAVLVVLGVWGYQGLANLTGNTEQRPIFNVRITENAASGSCVATEREWQDVELSTPDACAKPHHGEILGYPALAAAGTPYPGELRSNQLANLACTRLLAERGLGEYRTRFWLGDRKYWDQGQRRATCLLVRADGRPLAAGRVVAAARPQRVDTLRMDVFGTDRAFDPPAGTCVRHAQDYATHAHDPALVSCARPHWAQITGYPVLYPAGGRWPGDAAVNRAALDACHRIPLPRGFVVTYSWPSREWWTQRPKAAEYAVCLAIHADGRQFTGGPRAAAW